MENRLLRGAEGTSLRVELLRTDQDDPRVERCVFVRAWGGCPPSDDVSVFV